MSSLPLPQLGMSLLGISVVGQIFIVECLWGPLPGEIAMGRFAKLHQ